MTLPSSDKISRFLKESYPPKVQEAFFWMFIVGSVGVWFLNGYQYSTIDQRIAERKAQVERARENKISAGNAEYEKCLQAEKGKPKRDLYFSPCFHYDGLPLQTEYLYDEELQGLQGLKQNLESNIYYLVALLCFAIIFSTPIVLRASLLGGVLLWDRSRSVSTTLYLGLKRMSSFQKSSLILLALIFITLVILTSTLLF